MPPTNLMDEYCADPKRYTELRQRLVKYFDWRGCADPEDLADETITRATRRIGEGAVSGATSPSDNGAPLPSGSDAILPYCYGIAKWVLKEYRHRASKTDPLGELAEDTGAVDSRQTIDTRLALEQCLKKLAPRHAALLVSYYLYDREQLAEQLGISANALRVRVFRIIEELRQLCKASGPQ